MRLDELSSLFRLRRRTKVDSFPRRVMGLVSVFIPDKLNRRQRKTFAQVRPRLIILCVSCIKTANGAGAWQCLVSIRLLRSPKNVFNDRSDHVETQPNLPPNNVYCLQWKLKPVNVECLDFSFIMIAGALGLPPQQLQRPRPRSLQSLKFLPRRS